MSRGLYGSCYCGLDVIISRQNNSGTTMCLLVKYIVLVIIISKPYMIFQI